MVAHVFYASLAIRSISISTRSRVRSRISIVSLNVMSTSTRVTLTTNVCYVYDDSYQRYYQYYNNTRDLCYPCH